MAPTREQLNKNAKTYRLKYPKRVKETLKRYRANTIEQRRVYRRLYLQRQRMVVLNFYGDGKPHCKCCGENNVKFLAIDHINGRGKDQRRMATGLFYNWIIKNNFPDFLQLLCHNCNMAKGLYGKCPHKDI